jgi:HSP20 family protein
MYINEFNHLIDTFFNTPKQTLSFNKPAINNIEYPTYFELTLAAPGLKKEDFDLHVENDILTISTNKIKTKDCCKDTIIHRNEFNYDNFKRSFKLNKKYDQNNIKAEYKDGILKITILKKENKNKLNIKII